MFVNNLNGAYRTPWQNPYLGQNVFGSPLAYGQSLFGTQVPYIWNQIPFAGWNQVPFTPSFTTPQLGNVPFCYGMNNVMGGQFLPQTLTQPIGGLNVSGIPFGNQTLGYGINNTIGQGFNTLTGTFQHPILGCC
jgi:hypothetical protein